jgi:hypothetical protein
MTTLNTEELLSAALDADPGNHLLRYALADCLEESAGTVGCPECLGTGRINYGLADGDCGRCSGTGRVSDGRRERAEGYRVLAQLGLCPEPREGRWVWFGSSLGLRPGDLPEPWRAALGQPFGSGARYPTRRAAEDAAALAWGTLPAAVRAKILGAG